MTTTRIELLDHGYIEVVETWGSDQAIVEAARMSTGKGFLGWGPLYERVPSMLPSGGETIVEKPGDEKLLKYLYENKHETPFEMAGMQLEVQAPIFVFREWHRHRTQSYSEASARYAPLPAFDYVPTVDRIMLGGGHLTKQARAHGETAVTPELAADWQGMLAAQYEQAEELYQWGLANGIPKELARVVMPVGRYSKMRAQAVLRNWLGFMALRSHPTAQWEIRQYSDALAVLLRERFPRTMDLFSAGRAR